MASIEEIITNMAGNASPEKLAGVNLAIQFDLSGSEAGSYYVSITDGKADSGKGSVDNPTATIKMDSDDYKDLMSGKLNPMTAFMSGKVKVDGDLSAVMKLQSLFGFG